MWLQQEDSFDHISHDDSILNHPQLLPPAIDILPRQLINSLPFALMPLLNLPTFQGLTPQEERLGGQSHQDEIQGELSWIGEAFKNLIYKRFSNVSYCRIEQDNWNMWLCDINKLPGGSPPACANDSTDDIVFQSRFEGGNLSAVSKVSQSQFNLLLQNDTNSKGYTQWFFFMVRVRRGPQTIKFNILNFEGSTSLFAQGMQPAVHSLKKSKEENLGWHRNGKNVCYYRNGYCLGKNRQLYTLAFDYQFQFQQDQVYFAYGYPYNYSDLMTFLARVTLQDSQKYFKRSLLTKSIAKNRVEVITITDPNTNDKFRKMGVILTARVHPGETVSSFQIAAIIQYLISDCKTAAKLREHFVFKIFPMLNPDGVIHGNSQCSLGGSDLSKKWKNPSASAHPQIFYAKQAIFQFAKQFQVVLFCDFHGHKKRKSAFCYGCHDSAFPQSTRQFPFVMSKMVQDFLYEQCGFTGHVQSILPMIWKELKISNAFVIETSFCGPLEEDKQFSPAYFRLLGQQFCQSVLTYFRPEVRSRHLSAAIREKVSFQDGQQQHPQEKMRARIMTEFQEQEERSQRTQSNSMGSVHLSQRKLSVAEYISKKYFWLQQHPESIHSTSLSQSPQTIPRHKSLAVAPKQFIIKEHRPSRDQIKSRVNELKQERLQSKSKSVSKAVIRMPTKCISPCIEMQICRTPFLPCSKEDVLKSSKSSMGNSRFRITSRPSADNTFQRVVQSLRKK